MDHRNSFTRSLSELFETSRNLNFDISLTPEEVDDYIVKKSLYFDWAGTHSKVEAALFISKDGECGFIASTGLHPHSYRKLVVSFKQFVLTLPEHLRHKLWARVQHNNPVAQKLAKRIGFSQVEVTDHSIFYLYGGQ